MSYNFKYKYEVAKILRDNILLGLESFGLPIAASKDEDGWRCVESDQPSYRNLDRVVTYFMDKTERVGWQGWKEEIYLPETRKYEVRERFIEQQEWSIRVLYKSTTALVEEGAIPLTVHDIASMLIAWFNRLGALEFRINDCCNLFVQQKDVQSYKDNSDVQQWVVKFPLKLQVPKVFVTEIDSAEPQFGGMHAVIPGGIS